MEDLGAVGDARLGEDEALRPVVALGDRLPRHVRPILDSGSLTVCEVNRVVDVAHGVGVGEADVDDDAVPEVAMQVAGVVGCRDARSRATIR